MTDRQGLWICLEKSGYLSSLNLYNCTFRCTQCMYTEIGPIVLRPKKLYEIERRLNAMSKGVVKQSCL